MINLIKSKLQIFNIFQGNILLKVLFTILIIFIVFQLYVLTTVGTQGEKVSALRLQQSELKIENEIKRAQIMQLQSSNLIQETVSSLKMSQVSVEYIDPELMQVNAMK
ncbi:MAG: hypothetical protein WCJ58_06635 [bacterium]